jgi:hypothetical protein
LSALPLTDQIRSIYFHGAEGWASLECDFKSKIAFVGYLNEICPLENFKDAVSKIL